MKTYCAAVLIAAVLAPGLSVAADPVSLESEAALPKYWVFDAAATFPLLDAAGDVTVVPVDAARKAGKWEKTFSVKIDSTGKVVSAVCVDCAEGDAVAPVIQKTLLLNRFKPAPGNAGRAEVIVPMRMSLTPPKI